MPTCLRCVYGGAAENTGPHRSPLQTIWGDSSSHSFTEGPEQKPTKRTTGRPSCERRPDESGGGQLELSQTAQ